MSDPTYRIDDTGAAVYPNGFTWPCEDMGCAFVARYWHGGQATDLYALNCGDFSPETICGAVGELESAYEGIGQSLSADDDIEAAQAIEDLNRWADGVRSLTGAA